MKWDLKWQGFLLVPILCVSMFAERSLAAVQENTLETNALGESAPEPQGANPLNGAVSSSVPMDVSTTDVSTKVNHLALPPVEAAERAEAAELVRVAPSVAVPTSIQMAEGEVGSAGGFSTAFDAKDKAQLEQYEAEMGRTAPRNHRVQTDSTLGQVTSIDQFSDVQPTDWAYQALQSLVERYGCIVGYPDGTYRGQRALTRFEFAAGMNACLDRISELLAASTADLATREDLATLQRLQEEFAAELAALRGRVDVLEARTTALEANQFSTTAKLNGETLFFVSQLFGGDNDEDDIEYDNQVVGQYRVRLNFDTSFVGDDILRVRLQAGNLTGGSFAFDQPGNEISYGAFAASGDSVVIDSLKYEFFPFDQLRLGVYANGTGLDEVTFGNTINPLDNPARSAISRFARNAIYRTANTSNGLAANLFLTRDISVQASYMAVEQSNPAPGAGLFNGDYAALGQLTFRNIFDVVDLAFTYVNSYNGTSAAPDGSIRAGVPFALGSRLARVDADRPVISNSYGVQTNFKLFNGFQIGGWAGFSAVRAIELGDADVWNYAVTLAFPDLFKQGSLGGVILGMQPRLTGSTPALGERLGRRSDPDVGYHIEAFYRYALNDNIDITPGIVWLTAPNHDADNDDIIFGTIRTTFRF